MIFVFLTNGHPVAYFSSKQLWLSFITASKKKKIHFKTSQTQLVQKSYLVMQQGYKERYVILQFFTGQSIMLVKTELRKIAEIEKNQNLILI